MDNNFYRDKNEYAISTYLFENWDLESALHSVAAHGFNSVELWADESHHVDPRSLADEHKVRALLKEYNIRVHSIHTPFRKFRPFDSIEEARAHRINVKKASIDFCGRFEIPIAVIHACDRKEYNASKADIPYLHDALTELADYAHKQGVKLALENIPSGKNKDDEVLCTLINQHALFGDIKNLYFCLDIGHVTITSNDMQKEIETVEPERLITFHIHNNDGKSDSHRLPDDGIIDWPKWHDMIRNRGFKDQFVFEICEYGNPFAKMDAISALFKE